MNFFKTLIDFVTFDNEIKDKICLFNSVLIKTTF